MKTKTGNTKRHDFDDRPICPVCNYRVRPFIQFSVKDGRPLFKKKCAPCSGRPNERVSSSQRYYVEAIKRKKETLLCVGCGFKAKDAVQLDVDHIDGNRDNNDPSNHQILCANCHRLKTKVNKEGFYGNHRKG